MRILMVTPMPPQTQAPGAIPLVLHAELTGLRQRHEVDLATINGSEPGEQEAVEQLRASGIKVYATQRHPEQGLGAWSRRWRMGRAWLSRKYPWRTIWFWEPGFQRILDDLFSRVKYDLVVIEDNSMGVYTYRTSAPTLFTEHEVRLPRPLDWSGFWKRSPFHWALQEADWSAWRDYQVSTWKRFHRIQAFTQRDAERIRSLAPDLASRVRVNPFGIELPVEARRERQEEGSLLFMGNFTHAPNVDAALWLGKEIMPILRQQVSGVRLSIVGIYPPDDVRDLAAADIEVRGPVEQIEPYLEKAAVVIAPLRIGGGMRMKVLQSMAMGKAVATTPRGAEGLAFDGEDLPLAVAEGAQGIASAVASLLSDPAWRDELGRQARLYVEHHFSPQAYASRIEAIYAEMTSVQESEPAWAG